MASTELQQFQVPSDRNTDDELWRARATVRAHAVDGADRAELLAMLGLSFDADTSRALCGTYQGRNRHKALGEVVCRACRDAWNAHYREVAARARRAREASLPAPLTPKPCAGPDAARLIAERMDEGWPS